MRRRKPKFTESLQVRLTTNEKDALWHASEMYGIDISEIIRSWIHERLPVKPDPDSNIRQMPLYGTHLSEVPSPTPREANGNGQTSAKVCIGRKSDPEHACHYHAYQDYDQCRGCAIADIDERNIRRLEAQENYERAKKQVRGTKLY